MKTNIALIVGGILGGMAANGVTSILPANAQENAFVHGGLSLASGFAYTKVEGNDSKDNVLRGALLGTAIVEGLKTIRIISNKSLDSKLTSTNKATTFTRGFLGLNAPEDLYDEMAGLNGGEYLMGADGELYQIDATGLSGVYMDEAGNVFEDGLHGAEDLYEEVASLNAPDDLYDEMASLNGADAELYEEVA